jgi:hypothetical protein
LQRQFDQQRPDRLVLRRNFANAQRIDDQRQKEPKIRRFDDDGQSPAPPEIFRRWKQFLPIDSADADLLQIRRKSRRQFQSRQRHVALLVPPTITPTIVILQDSFGNDERHDDGRK